MGSVNVTVEATVSVLCEPWAAVSPDEAHGSQEALTVATASDWRGRI